MKRRLAITFTATVLGLCICSITALSAGGDEKQEAQKAVLKLVDSMNRKGGDDDVKAQIAAITKKFDELEPLMWVYKARGKKGIGMGKGGADDIELTIGKIGAPKYKLPPQKLAGMKADLIKAADLSKAIAKIAEQDKYAQQYAKKDPAKWKNYTKDMKKGADELMKAVKSDNADSVKKAALNLSASCTNCHSDFRE